MKTQLMNAIVGGVFATALMTMVAWMGPIMGLPEMNPAAMMAQMFGMPLAMGWVMHFMIGISFASVFQFLWRTRVGKGNLVWSGALFGVTVFALAQAMMLAVGIMEGKLPPADDLLLGMIGSLTGHVIFGLVVGMSANAVKPAAAKAVTA